MLRKRRRSVADVSKSVVDTSPTRSRRFTNALLTLWLMDGGDSRVRRGRIENYKRRKKGALFAKIERIKMGVGGALKKEGLRKRKQKMRVRSCLSAFVRGLFAHNRGLKVIF